MRRIAALLPLLLAQCVSESSSSMRSPVATQALTIDSAPVALVAGDPAQRRVGALTFLGGWKLSSDNPPFGGFSSLAVEGGNQVTALSDAGFFLRFRLGQFGHVADARIVALPKGCGGDGPYDRRDTESLAHDPARGKWWIGFENRNAICRTSDDFGVGEVVVRPRVMANWPKTLGPETILRLADGRFLVFAEGVRGGGAVRPVAMFDDDPADPASKVTMLGYRPPDGFSPTDAARLPDGRILVLNRRLSLPSLFAARLVLIDSPPDKAGAIMQGRVIARFEPPVIADNYEGIAITVEDGRPIIWIVSDDNYMSWERTLLLKFALN